ncbi:DinB family protein [Marinigracilibium pacificum]|uniref:DinB family protein n=1 Tax=Marinigracilibium pacificum TaxID=2729599 RepID=A0A848IRW0_9BACT|nr:DinB family protein [Marinigracilibium pacificum]NMM47203.1 DinB family protein [Marinigracilibium pacificum]
MKKLLLPLLMVIPALLFSQSSFQKDLAGMIKANSDKVISLAEAIPAQDYGWRPADDIRSVNDVVLHITGANYFFPTFAGVEIPAGIDPRNMNIVGKEASIEALKKSYDHMINSVMSIPEDKLDNMVDVFGSQMTLRSVLLIAFGHCEEHMGQLIAYARSNNIAPPWSEGK